ncbi:MAG: IclR family transcriptional regulator [Deltaproteobacteria bacterium]|jgi:DNA-binding IclR family transcriptional regulator|nr:IclR family transcriptional regulator [Deltaproteobacteria bacterium]
MGTRVLSYYGADMDESKNYARINSLVKALKTLETLSLQPKWGLAELTARLGMPKTTVCRLIYTLEEMGYVSQEKVRGEYSLTSKLFQLGSQVINHSGLVDLARPDCLKLRSTVGETVNLCIPHETDMLVVDIQVGNHPLRQDTKIGVGFSMIRSASGRAYLAFLKNPEAEELLERIREEEKLPKKEWQSLLGELDETKEGGIGYDNEEIFSGVRCVAAPIFDHQTNVVATISVSAPVVRLNGKILAKMADAVVETASEISTRLGVPRYPHPHGKEAKAS